MRSLLRVIGALALVCLAGSAALARADEGGRGLDDIREDVVKAVADGAFERALVLLRAVKESSLDAASKLEREQRIAEVAAKQQETFAADRQRAQAFEKERKFAEAVAALDGVAHYGSEKHVAEARTEQERLRVAGEKAAIEARHRADEEKKKRAAAAVHDAAEARARVGHWLEARKHLGCSRCHGKRELACSSCEGTGHRKLMGQGRLTPRGGVPDSVPCEKCKATGRVPCADCHGSGFAVYKLTEVIWSAWPATFQKELDHAVGSKKKYLDQMVARYNKEPVASRAIDACSELIGSTLEPIKGYEHVEVAVDGATGIATAKYRVKLVMDERWEETRWAKGPDGHWALVPPVLAEGGNAAGSPAEKRE